MSDQTVLTDEQMGAIVREEHGSPYMAAKMRIARTVERAVLAALRQTRGEPSEQEIGAAWDDARSKTISQHDDHDAVWAVLPRSRGYDYRPHYRNFARALLSRWGGSGLSETERCVCRDGQNEVCDVCQRVGKRWLREAQREAFVNGCQFGADWHKVLRDPVQEAGNRYPAPAPPAIPKGVTLSDGSVVWRGNDAWLRGASVERGWHTARIIATDLLTQSTDTGADFEAVKAFASQVQRDAK